MGYPSEFVMKVLEEVVEVAASGERVSRYAAIVQVPKRWRTLKEVVERLGEDRESEYSGK